MVCDPRDLAGPELGGAAGVADPEPPVLAAAPSEHLWRKQERRRHAAKSATGVSF